MKPAQRKFNTRLIKYDNSYSVHEICELFGTHKNTVREWVRQGLTLNDIKKPYLIHGSNLIAFLKTKQNSQKKPCKPDEFYCCKCRQPRKTWEGILDIKILTPKRINLMGICEVCSTRIFKATSAIKLPETAKNFTIQQVHGKSLIATLPTTVRCYLENLEL